MKQAKVELPFIEKVNSLHKFLFCVLIGLLLYFSTGALKIDSLTHLMIGWDVFCLAMIVLNWITFFDSNSKQIRKLASNQDPKRGIVFTVVLISTLAGMLAVLLLIVAKKSGGGQDVLRISIAIAGMLLSWFLIHTIFTLRYAHIYYGDHKTKPNTHAAGLEFPEDDEPDYLDFAYFSFVLGMTFQVSDVQIASKKMRRIATFHGLLSFSFNTIMIALTINLIAGL